MSTAVVDETSGRNTNGPQRTSPEAKKFYNNTDHERPHTLRFVVVSEKLSVEMENHIRTGDTTSPMAVLEKIEELKTKMHRIMVTLDASLYKMTSPNITKEECPENEINRVIIFIKNQLENVIFPSFDREYRIRNKRKIRKENVRTVYNKIPELVGVLADFLSVQTVTDTTVLNAFSMGMACFFVDNINELQPSCLKLVTAIFNKYDKHRQLLLDDIVTSIMVHLPINKRYSRTYRLLNSEECIQTLTALVLQLIQCLAALPENLSIGKDENRASSSKTNVDTDALIYNKFKVATKTARKFVHMFLRKCRRDPGEIDYAQLFENFVQDLLTTVTKPEWPAAELLLNILAKLWIKNLSNESADDDLRVEVLDKLGGFAARLRKDLVTSQLKLPTIDRMVTNIETEEIKNNSNQNTSPKDKTLQDPDEEHLRFLQRVLLDYLAVNEQEDPAHRHARHFYLAQWYHDAVIEKNCIVSTSGKNKEKNNRKPKRARDGSDVDDSSDVEDTLNRVHDIELKKQFYFNKIRLYQDTPSILQSNIDYQDVKLISQYFASKRSFPDKFDCYLKQILLMLDEKSIAIQTKALKCLAMIVESDPSILAQSDIQLNVNHLFLDKTTSVKSAAVHLLTKYVLSNLELVDKHYDMISLKILDTDVNVQKRAIEVLIDICIDYPEYSKFSEICVNIIKRLDDDKEIRKLIMKGFENMWFTPCRVQPTLDRQSLSLKVKNITDVIASSEDIGVKWFEVRLLSLFDPREDKYDWIETRVEPSESLLTACKQIVDDLIENILQLKESTGSSERLAACLSTLYLFAKARPQLLVKHASTFQPYLTYKCEESADFQVINSAAQILELLVVHMEHPSKTFLTRLEQDLIKWIWAQKRTVVASCMACLGSIVNNVTRNYNLIRHFFNRYIFFLSKFKTKVEEDVNSPYIATWRVYFRRSMFTLSLLFRYFDFTNKELAKDLPENIKEQVFELVTYFLYSDDEDFQINTLGAVGSICIRNSELMLKDRLKNFYLKMLSEPGAHSEIKVGVLENIESYLLEEIQRQKQENVEKEIYLRTTGTVIQIYLEQMLSSFVHSNTKVRHAAMRIIQLILHQRLIYSEQVIPYLICMSTSNQKTFANSANVHLDEMANDNFCFIQTKLQYGIKLSYQLQKYEQNTDIVKGFHVKDKGAYPSALNGFLYSILRTSRQHRRAVVMSFLKQFNEQEGTSLSYMTYLADNLAYFRYRVQDEPLFIIHNIDITISVLDTNLQQAFRESLLRNNTNRPVQPAASLIDEEDETELLSHLPKDTLIYRSIMTARGCLLLLALKQHLKDIYGISNRNIFKYSSVEVHEQKITRRGNAYFNPTAILTERLPPSNSDEARREKLISQYLKLKDLLRTPYPAHENINSGIPTKALALSLNCNSRSTAQFVAHEKSAELVAQLEHQPRISKPVTSNRGPEGTEQPMKSALCPHRVEKINKLQQINTTSSGEYNGKRSIISSLSEDSSAKRRKLMSTLWEDSDSDIFNV